MLFDIVIFLVVNDWILVDKLLVLFILAIFLFSALPWSLEVRWLAIADSEVGEIKCAFEEDLALKGWFLDKILLTWWPWKFALEDAIETLPTMSDELIILVDFLLWVMVLLVEDNEDKLLVFFSAGVFLEEGWITFVDLGK